MGGNEEDEEPKVKKSRKHKAVLWTHREMPPDGLPDKVNLEDVISQDEDDRLLIDSLLETSEEGLDDTSQLIGTLFCGDWRDAVTGWSLTQPNVKYAWLDKAPKKPEQDRKSRRDAAYLAKKKQLQKEKSQQEIDDYEYGRSWRTKVEPGTYRYNPDIRGVIKPEPMMLHKREVDPTLQHHIDKVREHLEKTLMKQTTGGDSLQDRLLQIEQKEPLPGIEHKENEDEGGSKLTAKDHKHGQYVVTLAERASKQSQDDMEIGGKGDASFQRNGYGRQSDTKLLTRNHHLLQYHKKQQDQTHDLVTSLSQKLNEILMDDAIKTSRGIANLSLSRRVQKASIYNSSSATNSYERFPTMSISPTPQQQQSDPSHQQNLKPLTKITPHQRHVHDNNEIIAITSHEKVTVSKTGTAQSSTGSLGVPFEMDGMIMEVAPNHDFIEIGISGHRVHSAKSTHSGHNQQQLQQNLSSSGRLQKLPLTHAKTQHTRRLSASSQLAEKDEGIDELHRGVIDREAASALASVLMPGVSGRKIEAAPTA